MKSIYLKEISSFLSQVVGYVAILAFLIASGLVLWVWPDVNILDYGYATLEQFFAFAPWLLLFLIPAITMRSFSDEIKLGTIEWLSTKPISTWQLVLGKYLASATLVVIAIIPTCVYLFAVYWLAMEDAALDWGGIMGSYIGLLLLVSCFTAIGTFCSAVSDSQIISFLLSLALCLILYIGFEAFSRLPVFAGGIDYYLGLIGMDYHYLSMSRGVINLRDLLYFASITTLFITLTSTVLKNRQLR